MEKRISLCSVGNTTVRAHHLFECHQHFPPQVVNLILPSQQSFVTLPWLQTCFCPCLWGWWQRSVLGWGFRISPRSNLVQLLQAGARGNTTANHSAGALGLRNISVFPNTSYQLILFFDVTTTSLLAAFNLLLGGNKLIFLFLAWKPPGDHLGRSSCIFWGVGPRGPWDVCAERARGIPHQQSCRTFTGWCLSQWSLSEEKVFSQTWYSSYSCTYSGWEIQAETPLNNVSH